MFCLGSWHDWRRMKIFLCIEKIINNGASEPPDNARQRSRLTLINPKKLHLMLSPPPYSVDQRRLQIESLPHLHSI